MTYVELLINDIPLSAYFGLLFFFCIGVVLLRIWKKQINVRSVAGILLVEYTCLVYSSTVLFRPVLKGEKYCFIPFWSYDHPEFLVENMMNVMAFIPIGVLLGLSSLTMTWTKSLFIGIGLSIGIELLQFISQRGFSETDDVMHNTLGCLIGYGIYCCIKRLASSKKVRIYKMYVHEMDI